MSRFKIDRKQELKEIIEHVIDELETPIPFDCANDDTFIKVSHLKEYFDIGK